MRNRLFFPSDYDLEYSACECTAILGHLCMLFEPWKF